jgi:hypothetical protein
MLRPAVAISPLAVRNTRCAAKSGTRRAAAAFGALIFAIYRRGKTRPEPSPTGPGEDRRHVLPLRHWQKESDKTEKPAAPLMCINIRHGRGGFDLRVDSAA